MSDELTVRTNADAIGKGPTDVDPKLPWLFFGHRYTKPLRSPESLQEEFNVLPDLHYRNLLVGAGSKGVPPRCRTICLVDEAQASSITARSTDTPG